MNPLLNPNVAYVLLVMGFITGVLALFSPGTSLLEIGALFALLLAGYSIANLPFNAWALGLMMVGFIPFLISLRVRRPRLRGVLLGSALITYILGSAFLFTDDSGRPAVNLVLILILSTFSIGIAWLMTRKSLDAVGSQPTFDLDRLIGMQGQANSDLNPQGTVYVNGETWTASSATFIPAGSIVRVLARNGLALEVIIERSSDLTPPEAR
jgi:membrane-bound serine protease (ClpP class)